MPLLFVWRPLLVLVGAIVISACSNNKPPPFTATGYVADQGAMRIWRKDNADGSTHMLTVFSPWKDGTTVTSEYRWQGDQLTLAALNIHSKPPESIKMRFDDRGEPSFMQREVNNQKQSLSNDRIALYQYNAARSKETSEALRIGHVILRQGRWHQDETVTTCEGETITPKLDRVSRNYIVRRQKHSSLAVNIAWLEAPEGSQLLLVANQDFCRWQPKASDF